MLLLVLLLSMSYIFKMIPLTCIALTSTPKCDDPDVTEHLRVANICQGKKEISFVKSKKKKKVSAMHELISLQKLLIKTRLASPPQKATGREEG